MNVQDTPMNAGAFGTTAGYDSGTSQTSGARGATGPCPTCGQSPMVNSGLEQFLGRLGISDDMIKELRTSLENVDVEEYVNTARDYLKKSSSRAGLFARNNPRKVIAGVAIMAIGAGLLFKALGRH